MLCCSKMGNGRAAPLRLDAAQRHAATIASKVKNTTQFAGNALSSPHQISMTCQCAKFSPLSKPVETRRPSSTDLMSVGASPAQKTRTPSALTARLAAVKTDIRSGTLPETSGCTDWIRVLSTSSGKVACVRRAHRSVSVVPWWKSRRPVKHPPELDSPTKRPSLPTPQPASARPILVHPSRPRPPGSDYHARSTSDHVYAYAPWPRPSCTP